MNRTDRLLAILIELQRTHIVTTKSLAEKFEICKRMIYRDMQALLQLVEKMKELEPKLSSIPSDRKVEHPGLGYLNAAEWFQLVYMHFAHHLHQKERLEQCIALK